jgi:hypothetical protein
LGRPEEVKPDVILGLRAINRRIPGALIAVVGSIVISWAADLSSHGAATLGKLPGGLPSIGFPYLEKFVAIRLDPGGRWHTERCDSLERSRLVG